MHTNSARLHKSCAKLSTLPPRLYFLYLGVFLLSALARLIILFVPFKHLSRFFGKSENSLSGNYPENKVTLIQEIGLAVSRVAKHTPWRCMCFEQGLIAKVLLSLHGIGSTLIFGVATPNHGKIQAHAWLRCGDILVVGGEKIEKFGIIASFS